MISISNSSMPNMSLGGVLNTAAVVLKTIYQEKEQEYVAEEKRVNGVNANSTTTIFNSCTSTVSTGSTVLMSN